ncbi:hypothetical protein RR48_07640 [Papilio machaon]|uniref:Uncharacterized protein n=1 Tax=Papilio machaon TaxID=76193 RepID=A0A194QPE6_PAPMA|nr:hypothetical protein RR48_07640 [Papilio machaon]
MRDDLDGAAAGGEGSPAATPKLRPLGLLSTLIRQQLELFVGDTCGPHRRPPRGRHAAQRHLPPSPDPTSLLNTTVLNERCEAATRGLSQHDVMHAGREGRHLMEHPASVTSRPIPAAYFNQSSDDKSIHIPLSYCAHILV